MTNKDRTRLFIGIRYRPNERVRSLLGELREIDNRRNPVIRGSAESNLHVTLKFIGSVAGGEVARIAEAMDAQLGGRSPFSYTLKGLGFFRTAAWLGVEGAPILPVMAGELDSALAGLGIARENRPYFPHLTVARIRPPRGRPKERRDTAATPDVLTSLAERYRDTVWDTVTVDSIQLYESETLPEGSRYSIIAETTLEGTDLDLHP